MSKLLEFVNADIAGQTLAERTPYKAGDTVNVHVKIKEGTKERIQQYQGVVIQIRNSGHPGMTFTVRKVSNGVGVERIFPVMSPSIEKVELVRQGKVRRARIYYLRDAKGKNARIKEKKRAVAAK